MRFAARLRLALRGKPQTRVKRGVESFQSNPKRCRGPGDSGAYVILTEWVKFLESEQSEDTRRTGCRIHGRGWPDDSSTTGTAEESWGRAMSTTAKGVGAVVGSSSHAVPAKFRNVLIVDDDPAMQRIVSEILGSAGYEVALAADGAEALGVLQRDFPSFLITDWDMPLLVGAELCRLVRLGELPRYVYIIILTGSSTDHLVEGLSSGAADFITKPVKTQELLARMQAGARVLDLEERLRLLAAHDPMTELLNRRSFFEIFDTEWRRSRRTGCRTLGRALPFGRCRSIRACG